VPEVAAAARRAGGEQRADRGGVLALQGLVEDRLPSLLAGNVGAGGDEAA